MVHKHRPGLVLVVRPNMRCVVRWNARNVLGYIVALARRLPSATPERRCLVKVALGPLHCEDLISEH